MDRQWVARYKESRPPQSPQDAKLSAIQRHMRNLSERDLARSLSPSRWQNLGPQERANEEEKWLKELSNKSESAQVLAIYALTALGKQRRSRASYRSRRIERRRTIVTAGWLPRLGIVGDLSVVPELVHLTYHYNSDTRLWAQISLVHSPERTSATTWPPGGNGG